MTILAVMPFLALRVLGVRDWRCYAITYASVPVYTSLYTGAISVALMLGFAVVWRGRTVVLTTAVLIAAKLFLWPFGVVLMALDGARRAILTGCIAIGIVLASWSVIGFADITRYPTMLAAVSAGEAHDSFSAQGAAYALGLSPAVGTDVGLALALLVGAFAFRAATRGRRDTALTLTLVAALLASPIVWMHYLSLLFVPLAARRPSFDLAWLLPLVFWLASPWSVNGNARAVLVCWPVVACMVVASLPGETGVASIRTALGWIPRRMPQT
jgi:hypothetical protein